MPRAKKTISAENSAVEKSPALNPSSLSLPPILKNLPPSKTLYRYVLVALVIVVVAFFLWKNKSLVVVALVNGRPIDRLTFESRLVNNFGKQTLDELINEQIILQAGQKKGIQVSEKEIADKITEIDKSLGGKISLTDALASQGLSLDEFRSQIRLQLTLEKLAGTNFTASDQELTSYIDQNKGSMTATDEAGLKAEATNAIISQKRNTALRTLFSNLQSQAKVTRFL